MAASSTTKRNFYLLLDGNFYFFIFIFFTISFCFVCFLLMAFVMLMSYTYIYLYILIIIYPVFYCLADVSSTFCVVSSSFILALINNKFFSFLQVFLFYILALGVHCIFCSIISKHYVYVCVCVFCVRS